jgi:DNA-binding IclR family transcriptional regulator
LATTYAKILDKGLNLLEELARSPQGMTAVELADKTGVHKTTIYRYLNTFFERGYVQTTGDGLYFLGNRILELGSEKLRQMPLRETAHPFLINLNSEIEMTVHLCVLDGQDVVYIDKIESHRTLPIISRIGSRAPAYCTGVGKALLGGLPTEQLTTLVKTMKLDRRTPTTITDPVDLVKEIKLTAKRGYAIDNGENEEGIICIAAPISAFGGDTIAAVSATGLRSDFSDLQASSTARLEVVKTAKDISMALGDQE